MFYPTAWVHGSKCRGWFISDLNGLLWNSMVIHLSGSGCTMAVIGFSTDMSFGKYVLHPSIKLVPLNWYRGIPWVLRIFRSFRQCNVVEGILLFGPIRQF